MKVGVRVRLTGGFFPRARDIALLLQGGYLLRAMLLRGKIEWILLYKEKIVLIQVLGTGCAKCVQMAERVEQAAKQSGIDFTFEKVTDVNKIVALGVMITPALLVDGQLKCSGTVPSIEELETILKG